MPVAAGVVPVFSGWRTPTRLIDVLDKVRSTVVAVRSHPTVGVARFGSNISDRLSSLSGEPAVGMKHLITRAFVLGLAHRSAGRVARTIFFQVLLCRVRY